MTGNYGLSGREVAGTTITAVTPSGGEEYLYFAFNRLIDGSLAWHSLGWTASEMGEWDNYQRLSIICSKMSQSPATPDR